MIPLPLITAGLTIGQLNIRTGEITPHPSNHITFSCQLSGDCCSQLNIPVTDFDIKRIEDHGYALDQIIELASPTIRFSSTDEGRGERNYWMKRKPFDDTCTFLGENKCTIHDFKPFGCRIFPFQLREITEDIVEVVIHSSNLCGSVRGVPAAAAENHSILEALRQEIISEHLYRQQYFSEYSKR